MLGGRRPCRPGKAERGPESAICKVCLWVKYWSLPEALSHVNCVPVDLSIPHL